MAGKDARRGTERAGDEMADRYATEMFTEEALNVIDTGKRRGGPMFLMVSHLAVHAGNKGPLHLDVANKTHNDVRFGYIADENRRLYAGKDDIDKHTRGSICTDTPNIRLCPF